MCGLERYLFLALLVVLVAMVLLMIKWKIEDREMESKVKEWLEGGSE